VVTAATLSVSNNCSLSSTTTTSSNSSNDNSSSTNNSSNSNDNMCNHTCGNDSIRLHSNRQTNGSTWMQLVRSLALYQLTACESSSLEATSLQAENYLCVWRTGQTQSLLGNFTLTVNLLMAPHAFHQQGLSRAFLVGSCMGSGTALNIMDLHRQRRGCRAMLQASMVEASNSSLAELIRPLGMLGDRLVPCTQK